MSDEKPLKSAFELAMERLNAEDKQAGVEHRPLTEAQQARIAEIRRDGEARLAEIEIRHRDDLNKAGGDPAKLHELEEKFQIDRGRIESRVESDVAKVKSEA